VTGKTLQYNCGHSVSDLRYPTLWWDAAGLGTGPFAGDMDTSAKYVNRTECLGTIIIFADVLRRVA